MTFNQSKYIKDSLNGFAMQKTDFPFVCLVMDDFSTDGEQEVIKAWMECECEMDKAEYIDIELSNVILVPHKSNHTCKFAFYLLKQNLYKAKERKFELLAPWRQCCEYEAICEGDDFWNDPLKLQKQVDWLDSHESCQMCCTDTHVVTSKGELDWSRYDKDTDIPVEDMILGGGLFVQTCTLVYRNSLILDKYPDYCLKCHVGDYPLQLWASINGGVHYFKEKNSSYRYQTANSWTSNNRASNIDAKIKGIRSEVDMLLGLDSYSNNKYHKAFSKRECDFVHDFAIYAGDGFRKKEDVKKVLSSFQDIYKEFSFLQKLDAFFMSHNMVFFFKVSRKIGNLIGKF